MAIGKVGQAYHTNQIHHMGVKVTFADLEETVTFPEPLPASVIQDVVVNVVTAFNSATSDVLDVGLNFTATSGLTDDPDRLATDVDLTTAGRLARDATLATAAGTVVPDGTQVTCLVDGTGTAATAGEAWVSVYYIPTDFFGNQ